MIRITNKNVFVLTIHKTFIFLSFPFLNQYEEDTALCQDFKKGATDDQKSSISLSRNPSVKGVGRFFWKNLEAKPLNIKLHRFAS